MIYYVNIRGQNLQTQNHDKMKTKTNISLEETCNGDVVGGLYREPRESLQALLFLTPRDRRCRPKRWCP